MSERHKYTNRLAGEKSPYLLQHAHNPVDWFPWGDEAFRAASEQDKPVFLSIGYSTCHWCHVMERESFDNEEIAALLNADFISIKVDREERPDIDSIYMGVCQAMTGGGGWPLSIMMTADKIPFLAATYIPPDDRRSYGMQGMKSILPSIAKSWKSNRGSLMDSASRVREFLNRGMDSGRSGEPGPELIASASALMKDSFDRRYGGFNEQGPKFPTAHNLSLLLRHWKRSGDSSVLEMVEVTLDNIIRGGIHDHVGGGFARYSTDREWLVPHFEKMLYDQAILARALLETYQSTGNEDYSAAARDIFGYVFRDLTSPEGAFYSAEDADSEGVEGKFYVWTEKEIDAALSGGDAELFKSYYDVTKSGNFEHGTNIPRIKEPVERFLKRHNIERDELEKRLAAARGKLFNIRARRVRPRLDDKVIVSWNGHIISALALGAQVLGDEKYYAAAARAADFILGNMFADGRLLRICRERKAAVPAFLDDYAFFGNSLLDLYETGFDAERVEVARKLADDMIKFFLDADSGAFTLSGAGNEKIFSRRPEAYDGAEPSGNSVAALFLLRLGALTGDGEYSRIGAGVIKVFTGLISNYPPGYTYMLTALDYYLGGPTEIVIAGDRNSHETIQLLKSVYSEFIPARMLALRPPDADGELEKRIPPVAGKKEVDGKPAAYVCVGRSCKAPVTDPVSLSALIKSR